MGVEEGSTSLYEKVGYYSGGCIRFLFLSIYLKLEPSTVVSIHISQSQSDRSFEQVVSKSRYSISALVNCLTC